MSLPVVLISEEEIQQRVTELAAQISEDYADSGDIVLVGVLKGAFIFLADLSRSMTIPRTIEFIAVSSYESGSKSSGAVRLVMDVRANIEGKHVLIVEDIVDTGHTLKYLIGVLESHRPASIKTAALLHKPERAEAVQKAIPLGRLGRPGDIAGLVHLLFGAGGAYMTGAVIPGVAS